MYIDKLDDTINKYNNSYYSTIKLKPIDVNQAHILTLVKKLMAKILNLKLVILLEYQNIKTFLQMTMFEIGLKKFLRLKKLKTLWRGHMLLVILKAKQLLERFTKKNCNNSLELRKQKRGKTINCMLNAKATIVLLTVGLIKET